MHHYQRVKHNMQMHSAVVVEDGKFISVFVTTVVRLHNIYLNMSIYSHIAEELCSIVFIYIIMEHYGMSLVSPYFNLLIYPDT